jgi:hypothetical protein
MFTPPLMTILAAVVGVLLFTGHRGDLTGTLLAVATPVITQFPITAGTTALTLIIGGVRLIRGRQTVRRRAEDPPEHARDKPRNPRSESPAQD